MNKRFLIQTLILLAIAASAVWASSSYFVHDGDTYTLTAVGAVEVGDPILVCNTGSGSGRLVGVAKTAAATTKTFTAGLRGIYDLVATSSARSIRIGDYIYANWAPTSTKTTLSEAKDGTDVIFGIALETLATSTSDRINILLIQSSE
jgi:predicted RecA/RadA family phage recombinase